MYKKENDLGTLSINLNVIENVVGRIIDEFDGSIIASDAKGRLKRGAIKNPLDNSGFLKARYDGKFLILRVYLIIKFGASINTIAKDLAAKIREEMPKTIGINVGVVKVEIVGTLSKNLTKRSIEIVDDDYPKEQ